MNTAEQSVKIAQELSKILGGVDPVCCEQLLENLLCAKKIFVAGAGRSKLMLQAFAMRLMHLGFTAYVVGEVVTPALEKEDLLVIGSGSGKTDGLVLMAKKAKVIGAKLALVTISKDSPLGKAADLILEIPASTSKRESENGFQSIQPGGNSFEQGMLLLLDSVILSLAEKQNRQVTFELHANLE